MKGLTGRIGLLLLIGAAIAAFFLFDLGRFLTLDYVKDQQAALGDLLDRKPALVVGGFFLAYVAVTSLSLPGAAIMTLAAGAIFGLWLGTLIVSFASAIGATLAFLSARYVLRDWVKSRFPKPVRAADRGVEKDGHFYLLTLRLIPVIPFFLVNLAMGLTAMRVLPYFLVSQVGMLAGTIVYVNAGTQLGAIESTRDILSPALIGSFVLLGLFPLIAKWAVGGWKRRKVYRGWKRPKRFDRNLIVIGAGAGGLVTSLIGATVRAKVTLIEKAKMGGDCLNTGCVPSKTLIRAARLAHEMRTADCYGLTPADPPVSFVKVMARVREAIRVIEPADSVERYTELGVDVRRGHATIVDPWTVTIDGKDRLTSRAIVIAAGGEPAVLPIPGLAESGYLTSDTLWDALATREAPPGRMVVIGGGPIGCELSQAFARLGSKVTMVEGGACILPKEDADVSGFMADVMDGEGVDLRLDHEALRVEGKVLVAR
ncbi:MAG: FAD-dependent oxidoreductase, partial [Sphingomonas sp.]|nr:FAD-dependent oxidoreductase [Sphingomonas sp.]